MNKRIRSDVWKFYEELSCGKKVKCKLCDTELSRGGVGKSASTSALKNHLFRKHPKENNEMLSSTSAEVEKELNEEKHVKQVKLSQPTLQQFTEKRKKWDISNTRAIEIHYLIGEMIALDNMPFITVGNRGFRRLMQKVLPNYDIPSRTYFSTHVIPKMYEQCVGKIKKHLTGVSFISMTSDIWTCSHTNESFISLTAHWISEEYEYKNVVLHCKHFPGSHTGESIKGILLEMLHMWKIQISSIHVVVRDNGRNITKGCSDANLPSVSCFIHTLQLIVNNSLSSQKAVSDMIPVCRKIVGHFNHSASACSKLKAIQNELGLPEKKLVQDVVTRWNSTYYMLERLQEQKRAVNLYFAENDCSVTQLINTQWNLMDSVLSLLRPFEQITKQISSETALLSQVIPIVRTLHTFTTREGDSYFGVGSMKSYFEKELKTRFQNLDENDFYTLATILDPRYKTAFHKTSVSKDHWQNFVTASYNKIFAEQNPVTDTQDECVIVKNITDDGGKNTSCFWDCFEEIASASTESSQAQPSGNRSVTDELEIYMAMPLVSRDENPLAWWKGNETVFPKLCKMSKKYLSAPASSVYSERTFSEAGNIYEETRNRLLPRNAEKLLFLHHNLEKLNYDYKF